MDGGLGAVRHVAQVEPSGGMQRLATAFGRQEVRTSGARPSPPLTKMLVLPSHTKAKPE